MYFRIIEKNDYKYFLNLINEFRPSFLTEETFNYILDSIKLQNEIWLIIDENTKEIVGTGILIFNQKFINHGGIVAHIEDVIISKKYKKQGYGKQMIDHLIKRAKNKNCYKIILNCSKNLIEFYNKCGFIQNNYQMEIRF